MTVEYNLSQLNLSNLKPGISYSCFKQGGYSIECLQHMLCPQFSQWIITAGILVVSSYIIVGWLLWAYWQFIFPRINWSKLYERNPWLLNPYGFYIGKFYINLFYFGDLRYASRRIFWDSFIRERMNKLLIGYIAVILYFALSR